MTGCNNHEYVFTVLFERGFTIRWSNFKSDLKQLSESLVSYDQYLDDANVQQKKHQSMNECIRQLKVGVSVTHCKPCEKDTASYNFTDEMITNSLDYQPVFVDELIHLQNPFPSRMEKKKFF